MLLSIVAAIARIFTYVLQGRIAGAVSKFLVELADALKVQRDLGVNVIGLAFGELAPQLAERLILYII